MKKLTIFAIMVTAMALVMSAEAKADNVKVIDNPTKVVITEKGGVSQVDVVTNNPDETYSYEVTRAKGTKSKSSWEWGVNVPLNDDDDDDDDEVKYPHWDLFLSGLYFGWGGSSADGALNKKLDYTTEIGLLNVIGLGFNPGPSTRLSFGVGFDTRRYNLEEPYFLSKNEADVVLINEFPAQARRREASVNVVSLQFPLAFSQGIGGKWRINLAAIPMWNCYAEMHRHFKIGDTRTDEDTNGMHQKPFSLDGMAAVTWRGLGVYFRYSPSKAFKSEYGPMIDKTWTVGITLGF